MRLVLSLLLLAGCVPSGVPCLDVVSGRAWAFEIEMNYSVANLYAINIGHAPAALLPDDEGWPEDAVHVTWEWQTPAGNWARNTPPEPLRVYRPPMASRTVSLVAPGERALVSSEHVVLPVDTPIRATYRHERGPSQSGGFGDPSLYCALESVRGTPPFRTTSPVVHVDFSYWRASPWPSLASRLGDGPAMLLFSTGPEPEAEPFVPSTARAMADRGLGALTVIAVPTHGRALGVSDVPEDLRVAFGVPPSRAAAVLVGQDGEVLGRWAGAVDAGAVRALLEGGP